MTSRRLLARVFLVGALVVGVVGMHHLVIAACHHLGVAPSSAAVVMDDHAGHGLPSEAPATPSPMQEAPAPAGAVGAAAMCLAVLLLVILVLAPRAWAHLRRSDARRAMRRILASLGGSARPPDLSTLSISRT